MLSNTVKNKINSRLKNIYSKNFNNTDLKVFSDEIINLIKISNKRIYKTKSKKLRVSEDTTVVICYGDSVYDNGKINSIKSFKNFYNKNLSKFFNTIHFLPFYPSSSDSGFAVKDHYKIDSKLGSWIDINNFSKNNNIVADIVINHASSKGLWFKNFLRNKSPGKDYFLKVNSKFDVSKVVRPRENKLLKKIDVFNKPDFIWRTFSPDQIDLNFKNPKVLMRFVKIMINLACHGVSIFRLDAIAYLWKESGTKCINLKQTHEIIKLLRIICNSLHNTPYLLTETNLPEKENLSYFGKNNDEANWIYNFTLPPLLVHAFLFEDSSKLNQWMSKLPPTKIKNNYFNFIASHDGIGMRPIEGYLNNSTLNSLFKRLKKNGAKLSFRKLNKTQKKVYEVNITLFNAFKNTDYDKNGLYSLERYISAHAIMFSIEGVPAVYFNSIFGKSNDEYKYIISNNKRDLNRYKWNKVKLEKFLKNKNSKQKIYYDHITNLLKIRKKQKAFHPNATMRCLSFGNKIFAFKRISLDKKQIIICITNMSSKSQSILLGNNENNYKKILYGINSKISKRLILKPFETVWLSN
tara:strand:- start:210 stop:1943 length:1734 start_codon:yes stop_codon:yes gene_type:complete